MQQKKTKISSPNKTAVALEKQSARQDLEMCMTVIITEMAQQLRSDYVSASFFRGSSFFMDSVEVGDIKIFEDSKIYSAIVGSEGALLSSAANKDKRIHGENFVVDREYIKSYIGTVIRNRENNAIGVICAFFCSDYRTSTETGNILKYYATRAAATLEIVNTSQTLKCVKTIQDVISVIDGLIKLGYKELAEYLLNQMHGIQSLNKKDS